MQPATFAALQLGRGLAASFKTTPALNGKAAIVPPPEPPWLVEAEEQPIMMMPAAGVSLAMSRAAARRSPARFDPSAVPGAKPTPFPGSVEPCHPTLREEAPSGARWIHEIKFDGYRTQAHLQSGRPAMYTRAGYDWTVRFQPIADALTALPANDVILDGEAVVADSRGIPDFGLLHADLAAGRQDRLLYYAFDLLYLDGLDLRGARLAERKRLLRELLAGASERNLFAEHLEEQGADIQSAPAPWAWRGSSANSGTRLIAPDA